MVLVNKNEDRITKIAIEQVNQLLETKISVDKVEISLFSKIPYVSVVFQNVIVWSPYNFNGDEFDTNEKEKLLVAEKIYLQFNLFQVLLKNYNISRILVLNGEANLLVDSDGKTNYQIIKEKTKANSPYTETPQIQLEAFRISNFNIKYISNSKNIFAEAELKDLILKGKFSQEEFSLASNISMLLKKLSYSNVSYAENYDLSIRTILAVKDRLATINKGLFSVNDINFSTSGIIDFTDDPKVNLQVIGRGLNISSILNMLPEELTKKLSFTLKGRADIATRIEGILSSTRSPDLNTVYLLSLDKFATENISLSNIQLKGKLLLPNNKEKVFPSFSIEKYRIDDSNNKLEGSFFLTNFSKPELKLNIMGYSDILFLNKLISPENLKDIKGHIQQNIQIETSLKSLKDISLQSLIHSRVSGQIEFINAGFIFKEGYNVDNLNGSLSLSENSWQTDLNLDYNGYKSTIKAKADYLLNYLFEENKALWLLADIQTEYLNTEVFYGEPDDSGSPTRGFFLPKNIYAKMNVSLDQFEHKNIMLQNLETKLEINPGNIDIINFSTNSMEGKASGSGMIYQDEKGKFVLASKSTLTNINVNKLFTSFNNFRQDVIRAEHINGDLSGDFEFSLNADSMLNIDLSSITMNSQVELNSGELINFEPAQELSRYIQLKELEHIKFSKISNTILIREEIITIPEMEILSSAFNINISGTHSFSNYFDYKIKVNLNELLAGKAKTSKLENEEHFVLEENGRRSSLYISVKGTPDDYQFKYDKKEALTNIKNDLKDEKNTLKKILNDEFGWFKKDSSSMGTIKEKIGAGFKFDWEEPADTITKKKTKQIRKANAEEKEGVMQFEWDDGDI